MPNISATVMEAASAISPGSAVSKDDTEVAVKFLMRSENSNTSGNLMEAVTGLSGSGPAYIFMIIERLPMAECTKGLTGNCKTACSTDRPGAARMVLDGGSHTGELKDMVTSPGGTTIRGLRVMEKTGVFELP